MKQRNPLGGSRRTTPRSSDFKERILRAVAPNERGPACPKCGWHTRLRTRQSDGKRFFGCSNYPACKGTLPLPGGWDPVTAKQRGKVATAQSQG